MGKHAGSWVSTRVISRARGKMGEHAAGESWKFNRLILLLYYNTKIIKRMEKMGNIYGILNSSNIYRELKEAFDLLQ